MGVTPLTKRQWFLSFVSLGISAVIGAFFWYTLFSLLSPHFMHLLVIGILLGFSLLMLSFLIWLRLMLAHFVWLKVWMILSPLAVSSMVLLPLSPLVSLPLVWCISLLFAVWGYYRCFSPLLGLDTSLHRARFAKRYELATLYTNQPEDTALLIGMNHWYSLFRRFVLVRKTVMRKELGNLLIVAPTRGGKGLLAMSQLLSWKSSTVVNDIKGELFAATAGYRRTLGNVYVIDPTGIGHCYDPLKTKETEEKLFSAATNILFDAEEREPIFTQRAIVMLTQLFLAAKQEGIPALVYVRHMIRSGLLEVAEHLNTLSPELATQFLDGSFAEVDFHDRFLHSAWSTLTTKLRPLLTETLVKCFTHSDFTAETLMRSETPVTVYFRWKEEDLHYVSPLVRLLWGSLINELITTYDNHQGQGCKPVLMLIDEAGRTAIPALADQATTVVGRGITLWIAIQSLSQLEVVYGKERAHVLRDNMESQVYYRPNDLATAQYLEERCGDKSGYAKSTTSRDGEVKSIGAAERPIPLLTAQEIMKLKDSEIIGFHRSLPPFTIRRLEWWRHPILRNRRTIPPPELPTLQPVSDILAHVVQRQTLSTAQRFADPDALLNIN